MAWKWRMILNFERNWKKTKMNIEMTVHLKGTTIYCWDNKLELSGTKNLTEMIKKKKMTPNHKHFKGHSWWESLSGWFTDFFARYHFMGCRSLQNVKLYRNKSAFAQRNSHGHCYLHLPFKTAHGTSLLRARVLVTSFVSVHTDHTQICTSYSNARRAKSCSSPWGKRNIFGITL